MLDENDVKKLIEAQKKVFATKEDLTGLKEVFATKEEFEGLIDIVATKEELENLKNIVATKEELKNTQKEILGEIGKRFDSVDEKLKGIDKLETRIEYLETVLNLPVKKN